MLKYRLYLFLLCFLYSIYSISLFAQEKSINGQVITKLKNDTISLPGAHVVVIHLDDKGSGTQHQTMITDSLGQFNLRLRNSNKYVVNISYLGYKSHRDTIVVDKNLESLGRIFLKEDALLLSEVSIEKSLKSQSADKRTYVFNANQKTNSMNALQLTAQLPGLRLERASNVLPSVNGKDVRVLINGLPATLTELRALSPKWVKSAIVYDVPPAEYNASGLLINVVVEYPDRSTSGDLNLTTGTLFSSFSPVISHVNKRNMWTFAMDSHLNSKRKFDYINGTETYTLSDQTISYDMDKKERMRSLWVTPSLSYLYSGKNIRIIGKASFGYYKERQEILSAYTSSVLSPVDQEIDSKVNNRNGEGSVYIHYKFDKYRSLIFSSKFVGHNNKQDLTADYSGKESDIQKLDIKRMLSANELVFRDFTHPFKYTMGLRSTFDKTDYDSQKDPYYTQRFSNTLYSEFFGQYRSLEYRASLFFNYDQNKSSLETYNRFNFNPEWMLSYAINSNFLVRYMGSLSTRRPSPQEMSDNLFVLSPLMYRSGNPFLRNELSLENELLFRFTQSKWQLDWSLISLNQFKPILLSYQLADKDGQEIILRQPTNAKRINRYETDLYLSLNLFDNNLNFGLDSRLIYFSLERDQPYGEYHKWLTRLAAYLSYRYKRMSFDYYQIIYGNEISDLNISDLEKISYVTVGYQKGNLGVYASLYFPFGQNKVNVKSLDAAPYHSTYDYRMRSKEKTFAITLSWFFGNTGKRLNNSQVIDYVDDNKGILKIK